MFARAIDPTQDEIRWMCEQIQKTWTDEIRRQRAGGGYQKSVLLLDREYRIHGVQMPQPDLGSEDF